MNIKIFSLLTMVTIALSINAQEYQNFIGRCDDDAYEAKNVAKEGIADFMSQRTAPVEVLPASQFLLDARYWTDGVYTFSTYDEGENSIGISFYMLSEQPIEDFKYIGEMIVKNGKVIVQNKPNAQVSIEKLGGQIMLVERNSQGVPVKAYYNLAGKEEIDHTHAGMFVNYMLMGKYVTPDGTNAVFGPNMPCYDLSDYMYRDPGLVAYHIDNKARVLHILYGGGRISRGDPNSPNYKSNVPGGGGAGAMTAPMLWDLVHTAGGMDVTIVRDEPTADHYPDFGTTGKTFSLQFVQSPFEGIPGRWAFASVIPLCHTILEMYPKQVLTLMRAEIYARHGDTFKDPKTQRYFNAQPWYKKSGQAVTLTDLERFNYQLIKHVESTKK